MKIKINIFVYFLVVFGLSIMWFIIGFDVASKRDNQAILHQAMQQNVVEYSLTSGDDPSRCVEFLTSDNFVGRSIIKNNFNICQK